MAGRKQHSIPQFLLKGFTAPANRGKAAQVFVYRKGRAPFLVATHGIAAQRDFYSEPDDAPAQTLDDSITAMEPSLATWVSQVREVPVETQVDSVKAAELATHLTMRNAHFRGVFVSAINTIVEGLAKLLGNERGLLQLLGLDSREPTAKFREHFRPALTERLANSQSRIPIAVLERIVFVLLRENFAQIYEQQEPIMTAGLEYLAAKVPDLTRKGHNKALMRNLAPEARVAHLAGLQWRAVEASADGAVLPDCVAVALGIIFRIACQRDVWAKSR